MSDINAAVGRKIGMEPQITWIASIPFEGQIVRLSFGEEWEAQRFSKEIERREIWPDFEHDIAAAWRLVEWMRGQGRMCRMEWEQSCRVWFSGEHGYFYEGDNQAEHENFATAICLAFCAANGIEVEQREEAQA